MQPRLSIPPARPIGWASMAVVAVTLCALLGLRPLQAQTGMIGYRGFSYGTSGPSAATSEKPESKLWWNDGLWWGSLYNPDVQDYHIYRLNLTTQTWVDTGTLLDNRGGTRADTLWDGQHLYVASHMYTSSSGAPDSNSDNWARLYRYSYQAATQTYTLDPGFPVTITRGKSETLVLAKDSTGQLWVTYIESDQVMVNRSLGDDLTWGVPFILPVTLKQAVTVSSDDISSVIAFQGDKIGIMWSNQTTSKMYFAVHHDTAADTVWEPEQAALPGPNCSEACADDHINLKSVQADGSGRVYAAVKTSLTSANAPLIMLLVRDLAGNWTSQVFGRVSDKHTRPIVLIDEEHNRVYMFATAPEGGGTIYYKSSALDNISFPAGQGMPFIQSALDVNLNNATSTKQNLNSATGLVVLASDSVSRYYVHNYLDLSLGGPTPTAASSSTAPALPTATNSGPTTTSTPTASPSPSTTPTSLPTSTPPAGPSNTPAPTLTPSTTPSNVPLKNISFEDGNLTHPTSGFDSKSGTVLLETAAPLKGLYSARIPNAGKSYLRENFPPTNDLYVTFYLQLHSLPAKETRIALISNGGATVGNLLLRPTGAVQLRHNTTNIGSAPPSVVVGTIYRFGLRQKAGSGGNAVLEAYLAIGDAPFGAPFATFTTGTWTSLADRFQLGATTAASLEATVDNVQLDARTMPAPSP